MTTIKNISNEAYQAYLMDALRGGDPLLCHSGRSRHRMGLELEELNIGLTYVRNVPCKDLVEMVQNATITDIPPKELINFSRADLVIEARDAEGDTHYIAVEASFTATQRDASRAQRNAALLTRFTGRLAYAVISSVRKDHDAEAEIAAGNAWWHDLEERDMEVE